MNNNNNKTIFFTRTSNLLCIAAVILFILSLYGMFMEFRRIFSYDSDYNLSGENSNAFEIRAEDSIYELVLESGSKLPETSDYLDNKVELGDDVSIEYYNMSNKELQVGDFTIKVGENYYVKGIQDIIVRILSEDKIYQSSVSILDQTSPEVTVADMIYNVGDEIKAENFIISYIDNSSDERYIASFENEEDYSNPGIYKVIIKTCDMSDNCTFTEAKLTIMEKIEIPEEKPDNNNQSSSNTTQTIAKKSNNSNNNGGSSTGSGTGNSSGNNNSNNNDNNNNNNNYNNAKNSQKSTDPAFWELVEKAKQYLNDNATAASNVQNTFITQSNITRAEFGSPALILDPELCLLAQVRILEYESLGWDESDTYMHKRPDGRDFSTVIKDYGYVAGIYNNTERRYGENYVSVGPGHPNYSNDGAYLLLRNSEGHYKNIVGPYFARMGVAKGVNRATNRVYWIQLFTT